ncbi:MAG TPA: ketoacyl-ACP synthase III [Acidimicrobiales bacterium]|nr:ketoacyl-ACP synthase III [Acidimicrobiales bacterium]
MTRAAFVGIGHALPERRVTSTDIEDRVRGGIDPRLIRSGVIESLSGVRERRHAPAGTASSDLAAQAAHRALDDAHLDPEDIDLLIFAAASHDISEPATSNVVQVKTGCVNASVVDIKNACNSFVNALDLAAAAIETGRAKRVLIATGEILSLFIDYDIKGVRELRTKFAALTLGDGGGAAVLEAVDSGNRGVYAGAFMSDGSQWELSTLLAGGTLMGRDTSRSFFECDSSALQDLAVRTVPPVFKNALASVGWTPDDVDLVVSHQVSIGIFERILPVISIPIERAMITVDRYGNTAAASIPLALSTAQEEGRLKRGDKVALVGAAAGWSVGVIPVIW